MSYTKDTSPSPFPRAHVARVLGPHEGKLGATLVARVLGHLAVKITFHLHPCYDLEVTFYEAGADGAKGAQLGACKTDRRGVARLDHLVDAGLYVCEIQNQAKPIVVPTIYDPRRPYVIPTPVDRPYFDFDEDPEFDHEPREVTDYEGDGGGGAAADGTEAGVMTVAFMMTSSDALEDQDPAFLLEATDGSYARQLSARSALVDQDGYQQVVFRDLNPGARYRLTKIHNAEYRSVVFDDASYAAIVAAQHDAGDRLADHQHHGFEIGAPADVTRT